jgi:hypothetical protein
LDRRLVALSHKILRKLSQAVEQRVPWPVDRQEHEGVPHLFHIDFCAREPAFRREFDRLTVAVLKERDSHHGVILA